MTREEAIKYIKSRCIGSTEERDGTQWSEAMWTAIEALADRPTGEWIEVTNGRGGHECSECHSYAPSYASGDEHLSDYCPNCGAKMGGDSE